MKNIKFIFCLLFTGILSLPAQNREWAVGVAFSPDICFRHLTANDNSFNGIIFQRNGRETPRLGFSAGLQVRKNLVSSGFIETGILVTNKGFASHMKLSVVTANNPDGEPGMSHTEYHFSYIDIPFKLNIPMTRTERKQFYLATGFMLNAFYEATSETVIFMESGGMQQFTTAPVVGLYRPFNASVMMGTGIDIKLMPRYNLLFEPLFKFNVLSDARQGPIRERLWTLGVNAVLYYGL